MKEVLFLLLVSPAGIHTSVAGEGAKEPHYDPTKPGYGIMRIFKKLSSYDSDSAVVHDFDEIESYTTSTREAELCYLAKDFFSGEAKSVQSRTAILLGDLSRYEYYQPLAIKLNEAPNMGSKGHLFRCAIDELQELISHQKYKKCINSLGSIHSP